MPVCFKKFVSKHCKDIFDDLKNEVTATYGASFAKNLLIFNCLTKSMYGYWTYHNMNDSQTDATYERFINLLKHFNAVRQIKHIGEFKEACIDNGMLFNNDYRCICAKKDPIPNYDAEIKNSIDDFTSKILGYTFEDCE